MPRLIPLALVAAGLAAVGIWWFTASPSDAAKGALLTPATSAPAGTAIAQSADWSANALGVPERLLVANVSQDVRQRIRSRMVGVQPLFADDQAFEQARQQQVLFATGVDPQTASQSVLANERRLQDDRQWISYDMRVLAARAEGDRFLLPLPGAPAAQAQIDMVELVQGNYRWSGRILGQPGGTFYITQAFADQYAVGALKTLGTEYLLEAKSGTGWVAESSQEFVLPPDGDDTLSDPVTPAKR